MTERTKAAQRSCAEWLVGCLNDGWQKSDLDLLEDIWWRHHDERSNIIAALGEGAARKGGEMTNVRPKTPPEYAAMLVRNTGRVEDIIEAGYLIDRQHEELAKASAEIERLRAEPTLSDFLDYVTEVYGSGHPAHIAASMFVDRLNTRAFEPAAK